MRYTLKKVLFTPSRRWHISARMGGIFQQERAAHFAGIRTYQDQWEYLSSIERISQDQLGAFVKKAGPHGKIMGIPLPSANEEAEEPWAALPSHREKEGLIAGVLPKTVSVVLANQIYLDRESLPPVLISRIV